MSIGETLRNQGFSLYPKYVNREKSDILYELGNQYNTDMSREFETKLTAIINHAVNSTKFYSVYSEDAALEDFPVISKEQLKQDSDNFISNAYSFSTGKILISNTCLII